MAAAASPAADDVSMADAPPKTQNASGYEDLVQTAHADAFAFSELEQRALDLYDQLRELELQRSLLEAQEQGISYDALQGRLITAQREAMEAKTEYEIRNRITHNVLVMDPVLKAVHGGEHTDYAEKRILPLITESDTVSMVHGTLAAKLTATAQALASAEQKNIAANQKNRELSQTLLALAEDMKSQSAEDITDPNLRSQVRKVEQEVKESRRRSKTIKGILSAMIVGSGLNWAADDVLRDLVMDDDEDG
ncbi:hypothetical protein BS50DRAFT_600382 [Corynespora cassiicola Philippines]|uniref:Centromere protein H C-terminal domain-containing protein n=1 Tax=Corynespora cassiicola Philippines TaxID=1448308 RepID=A0A2T2NMQ6_CORCC|nr:hypothetical protein BS50DRAFT_600382 [Corynespora cassiicola Philippines]